MYPVDYFSASEQKHLTQIAVRIWGRPTILNTLAHLQNFNLYSCMEGPQLIGRFDRRVCVNSLLLQTYPLDRMRCVKLSESS